MERGGDLGGWGGGDAGFSREINIQTAMTSSFTGFLDIVLDLAGSFRMASRRKQPAT